VLLGHVLRARRLQPTSGVARLIGAEARVLDWSDGAGHVWAEGERWQARGDTDPTEGAPARIRKIDGITLVVGRPADRRRRGGIDMEIWVFDWIIYGVLVVLVAGLFATAVRIFREYERGVVFTLGRFT